MRKYLGDLTFNGNTWPNTTVEYRANQLWIEDPIDMVAVVSENIPGYTPAEGCIFVKDYSENTGVLSALIDAGVLVPTGRAVVSGYVGLPEARVVI